MTSPLIARGWRWAALVCLLTVSAVSAADRPEIVLWPAGMPAPVVPADPPEKVENKGIQLRYNISKPRLVVYRAVAGAKPSKAGVIVVPGGGFGLLADEHEGSTTCEWLAKQGVTSFLLLHRTPTNMQTEPNTGPVQDLQKAVMEVRRRSVEYSLDPAQIGVLGFSAGGQVTLVAATNVPKFPLDAEGPSHKPSFLLVIYPYKIYDPVAKALRADIHPEAGLPPTFIAQMGDDPASLAQGSTLLFLECLNRKVPAELHIYEKGGHGFGMLPRPGATGPTDWPNRAADWLKQHGYLAAQ